MKEERISNYVKLCEEWAQRFLKMDQADLHKRVPELKEENGFLTIIHFGRRYGVSVLALSVTYGDRLPLLSPAVTSSPGAGEVFPQRESLWRNRSLGT